MSLQKKDHSHTQKHSAGDGSLTQAKLHTSSVKIKNLSLHTETLQTPKKNEKAAIHLPCSGSNSYLIETHDILGRSARINRGKDGFLAERKEGGGLKLM